MSSDAVAARVEYSIICEGSSFGRPHEPVKLDVYADPTIWTRCPYCAALFNIGLTTEPDYLSTIRPDEFGPPEFVEIEPIHNCNLRCVMCHVSYQEVSRVKIDPSFVDKMIGMSGKWAVVGGEFEPMSHPEIAQILRGLTNQGMKIDLTSNGTLFTDRAIDLIADCNIRRLTISFDGILKNTFESIRRNADYEVTLERIKKFKESVLQHNPTCKFNLNYTVMVNNVEEMADAVTYWEAAGFDHIGFIAMVIRSDTQYLREQSINSHMDIFQEQIDEAAHRILDGHYKITMSNSLGVCPSFPAVLHPQIPPQIIVSDHPDARGPLNPRPYFQRGPYPGMPVDCRSPQKAVKLLYDGSLQVCSKFTIGSIYDEGSLLDIWTGYQAEHIRNSIKREPRICYTCDYFRFCVNAGRIDYNDPENFKFIKTTDPKHVKYIFSHPLVDWAGEYYLLMHDRVQFDPRFSEITAEKVLFKCDYMNFGVALSGFLRDLPRRKVENLSNRHEFWLVGDRAMAIPRGSYDGHSLVIESPDEIQCGDNIEQLLSLIEINLNGGLPRSQPPIPDHVPMLVEVIQTYNIVLLKGQYIGIPQSAGQFEVDKTDFRKIDGTFITNDIVAMRKRVGEALLLGIELGL
jgi:radical SAM protein with 4Fe4S-binding SPASM domain